MSRTQTDRPEERAGFGFREVPASEKASLVDAVFTSVAHRYDLMNDLMSAGVHRLWKDRLVAALRIRPGESVLDLAGGTGDIARRIVARSGGAASVTLCDFNPAMVAAGRDRQIDQGLIAGVQWCVGDAETLPFDDHVFDAVSIAFGIRNVTRIPKALQEIHRVLRPGGRFFCLEFSRVNPALDPLYNLHLFQVLPRLGSLVAGDADSYRYLAESILRFPDRPAFAAMIEEAGFGRVGYEGLTFGVAAIHHGRRL